MLKLIRPLRCARCHVIFLFSAFLLNTSGISSRVKVLTALLLSVLTVLTGVLLQTGPTCHGDSACGAESVIVSSGHTRAHPLQT